jgi:uncharacterized membrane protein YhaH (DUF805 family)
MPLDMEAIRRTLNAVYSNSFRGRISRATFLIRIFVLSASIFILDTALNTILSPSTQTLKDVYGALLLVMLAVWVFGFAGAYVKRLHDIGWRGYWALVAVIAIPIAVAYAGSAYTSYRYDHDFSADLSSFERTITG